MGRRKISDMPSYKFSMDLSGDNKEAVDRTTENYGMRYGPFINLLIQTFCRMPKSMKKTFLDFCIVKCQELNEQILTAGAMEKKELEKEKSRYLEVARILNDGCEINKNEVDNDPTMTKIAIKNGYLIIPRNWILLNPEQSKDCLFAGVVECRNSDKFGIPHFCFFTDKKYASDYDKAYTNRIDKLCCKKWPEFENVIKNQVELIPDPEHKGQYLNEKEHLASPVIGHFSILATDDELYDADPPCGAMIVRTDATEES